MLAHFSFFFSFFFFFFFEGIRNNEELGKSSNWNIETVIDWKRIVEMYYQMNGEVDTEDVHVEIPS